MTKKATESGTPLIGRSTYERLLESFREHPGNISAAARSAGVGRGTARRAWREGWPRRQLPAIIDVMQEEQLLARSRRQAAVYLGDGPPASGADVPAASTAHVPPGDSGPEAARMLAKDDAVATREAEGSMVKLARANVVALMSATSRLLSAGIDKAKALEKDIRTGTVELTPKEVQKFLGSLGYLVSKSTESAKLAIEMERLLLGEPTEVLGLEVRNMTLDDAARTIELANRALARARKRGLVPDLDPAADLVPEVEAPADPSALH